MARKYYRGRRTYRRYARKKWTPYNSEVTIAQPASTLSSTYILENAATCIFGSSNSLGNYAAASDALSAINYYVCRVRFKGVVSAPSSQSGLNYIIYLCYVPNAATIDTGTNPLQDANLRQAYFYLHPEYVLAWTRLDYQTATGDTGEVRLYSKIKKRISPGDRICLVLLSRNGSSSSATISPVQGTFSCYLRTN